VERHAVGEIAVHEDRVGDRHLPRELAPAVADDHAVVAVRGEPEVAARHLDDLRVDLDGRRFDAGRPGGEERRDHAGAEADDDGLLGHPRRNRPGQEEAVGVVRRHLETRPNGKEALRHVVEVEEAPEPLVDDPDPVIGGLFLVDERAARERGAHLRARR
jgi:hypothetical protein